jgi:hypothetical protein
MQNMWLTATNYGIGFQLLSVMGILSKNRRFLELLKLPENMYKLEGCVIGIPENKPELKQDIKIEDFVAWMS